MNFSQEIQMIKDIALTLGFSAVGFSALEKNSPASLRFEQWLSQGFAGEMKYLERGLEKRKNPQLILPEAKSCIALTWDYGRLSSSLCKREGRRDLEFENPPVSPFFKGGDLSPYISRYAWFKDYHEILGDKLTKLELKLKEIFPTEHFRSYVDTGPVMEKEAAAQAGLGWVGKHTNLIDEKQGSYFFLASLLSTLHLAPNKAVKDRCGTCSRCIDICPTRAIVAPYVLDARLCISYLTIENKGPIPLELRKAIGQHVFGCDDCQEVCPWNREAKLPEEFLRNPSLDELHRYLEMNETEFKAYFKDSPILRSKRRGFLRNVCVVLGNLGKAESIPFLNRVLEDPEPLIREHAAWALEEIKG